MSTERPRRRFGRAVAILSGGTAVGQGVGLLAAPVISRVYEPQEFGRYSVVAAAATMLASVITLRMDAAVAVPKEDEDADLLALAGVLAVTGSGLIVLAFVLLWPAGVGRLLQLPAQVAWLWPVPVAGVLTAMFLILTQLAIRRQEYGRIGLRNAIQPSVTAVSQVGLSWPMPGLGLVVGFVLGRLVGVGSLLRHATLFRKGAIRRLRARSRTLLRSYWQFPAFGMPAKALNTVGLQIPPLLITAYFSTGDAGQYGMAFLVTSLPVTLLGAAIGQVFLSEFSADLHNDPRRARTLFDKASVRLGGLGLVTGLGILLFGPMIFGTVLGEQWHEAGKMAQALGVASGFRLLATPLAPALWVLRRQGLQLVLDAARLALTVAAFVAAWRLHYGALTAVWVYSLAMAVVYGVTWALSRWSTRSAIHQVEDDIR